MPSKVVVIGGGLGGMSAAITLRQRGFDVTLYEKTIISEASLIVVNRTVSVLI